MYFEIIIITDASGTGVGSNTCDTSFFTNGLCECFYGEPGALAPIGGCCNVNDQCESNKCDYDINGTFKCVEA